MTMTHVNGILGVDPFWRDEGLCSPTAAARAGTEGRAPVVADPDVFFDSAMSVRAKRICAACPVREECLAHALACNERYGIWGGTTPFDRRKMKRRNRGQQGRHLVLSSGGAGDADGTDGAEGAYEESAA